MRPKLGDETGGLGRKAKLRCKRARELREVGLLVFLEATRHQDAPNIRILGRIFHIFGGGEEDLGAGAEQNGNGAVVAAMNRVDCEVQRRPIPVVFRVYRSACLDEHSDRGLGARFRSSVERRGAH